MNSEIINPWRWQDNMGFVQANKVNQAEKILFCAGQTAMNAEGKPVHPNDMRAQIDYVLNNLQILMDQANIPFKNIMRLNYYTVDVERFFTESDVLYEYLQKVGCRPASTLLGVKQLAFPELLIEIEATAIL